MGSNGTMKHQWKQVLLMEISVLQSGGNIRAQVKYLHVEINLSISVTFLGASNFPTFSLIMLADKICHFHNMVGTCPQCPQCSQCPQCKRHPYVLQSVYPSRTKAWMGRRWGGRGGRRGRERRRRRGWWGRFTVMGQGIGCIRWGFSHSRNQSSEETTDSQCHCSLCSA